MTDFLTSTPLSDALDFYAKHGAALFPVPHGQKTPFGIISSFKHDFSRSPEQWARWQQENPGCNFGVVGFASNWIICDIDTSGGEAGRAEALTLWAELCASWGLPPLLGHVRSARGGFHVYFQVPAGVDASTLRQPDAIKDRINIRCVGYTIAAGSYYDGTAKGEESGTYTLFPDAGPPYPAPTALVEHCTRTPARPLSNSVPSNLDNDDVTALLRWMAEKEMFASYEDWFQAGMALKIYGDDGALWEICHDGSVTPSQAASKFESFASEPTADSVTIASLMKKAHSAGWTGSIRRSAASMFDGVAQRVAQLAVNCGATLPPLPYITLAPGVPLPGPCNIGDDEEAAERRSLRDCRIDAASLEGKPVPDREWQVHGLIPAKNVTLLYGDGGTGKSLLALQLGVAVVTGKPFFGHAVKQGRVEFITAEDSVDEMHRRLADIGRASGVPLGALAGLHLTSLADKDAMLAVAADSRGGALAVTALYGEMESVIADMRPALVVLDTLADVFGGNEIIRAQARQFIGMLRRLCLSYDCTIIVLAHPSLAGMDKGTSGSTAWGNSVRSRLYFKRIHESDGSEQDEDARVLSVGKSNYGRVGLEIRTQWRAGIFASTGGGGDPMVTAAKAERVFLDLLAKYAAQNRYVSVSEGKSYAPFIFRSDAVKEGVGKVALKDAMLRLLNRKRIENAPYGAPSKNMFRLYAIDLPTPANGMPTPANAP
jgi:hypothetical protein